MSIGLADDLRAMDVGDTIARVTTCPVVEAADRLERFRRNVQAQVSKTDGTFTSITVDGLTDGFTTAVRCLVIRRTA